MIWNPQRVDLLVSDTRCEVPLDLLLVALRTESNLDYTRSTHPPPSMSNDPRHYRPILPLQAHPPEDD